MTTRGIRSLIAIALLGAAACGHATDPGTDSGNGNLGQSGPFPAISGTYDITADGGCCAGHEEGVITLTQPSLTSKNFTGTYSTRFIGPHGEGSNGPMIEGSVTGWFYGAAQVQFTMNYPPNPSVTWTWTGAVDATGKVRIAGTWRQQAPDGSSETFTFALLHR